MEFSAVAANLDVLVLGVFRRNIHLRQADIHANGSDPHVGRTIKLDAQVLVDFVENLVVGGGGQNAHLEELVSRKVHARLGGAQRTVTALFVGADLAGRVGRGV